MRISSKNTGIVQEIPREQWEVMRKNGDSRNYNVESESDEDLLSEEIKVEPIALFDKGDDMAGGDDTRVDAGDEIDEVVFLKEQLDALGIKYTWNEGIEKLRKKYGESI